MAKKKVLDSNVFYLLKDKPMKDIIEEAYNGIDTIFDCDLPEIHIRSQLTEVIRDFLRVLEYKQISTSSFLQQNIRADLADYISQLTEQEEPEDNILMFAKFNQNQISLFLTMRMFVSEHFDFITSNPRELFESKDDFQRAKEAFIKGCNHCIERLHEQAQNLSDNELEEIVAVSNERNTCGISWITLNASCIRNNIKKTWSELQY